MLSQSPKTGAEIIDDIERLTEGWWRPSPGSVYPMLKEMEAEGVVKRREDGKYELLQSIGSLWKGIIAPRDVEGILTEMESYIMYLEDLQRRDKTQLSKHKEKLRELANKLADLLSSI